MHRYLVPLVALALVLLTGAVPHYQRQRVTGGSSVLLLAPLTSGLNGGTGTFSGIRNCETTNSPSADALELADGAYCQSSSLGIRIGAGVTNLCDFPDEIDNWTATGATVTANHAVAPDAGMWADRVQMAASGHRVVNATVNIASPHSKIVHSIFLKSQTANCVVFLGNNNLVAAAIPGEHITITTQWQRYFVNTLSSVTGDYDSYLGRLDATDTCTDILAWGNVVQQGVDGPGMFSNGNSVSEKLTWPALGNIRMGAGYAEFTISAANKASWHHFTDATLLEVEVGGGGYWMLDYDAVADELSFNAGGASARASAVFSPWQTDLTIRLAWKAGAPLWIQVGDQKPQTSSGNYTAPALLAGGKIYLGSTLSGTGQADLFYKNLLIRKRYRSSTIGEDYYVRLKSNLTQTTGTNPATFTRATAWTCMASGGASMADLAIDAPCYYTSAEDSGGPDGDAVGLRIAGAATNYTRGDMDGANGAVPTDWAGGTANYPLVDTGTTFHGQVAKYTEDATAVQVIYQNNVFAVGTPARFTYWTKNSSGQPGHTYHMNIGVPSLLDIVWAHTGWTRRSVYNAAPSSVYDYYGSATTVATPPASGTYYVDAAMAERSVNHASPFCAGAAPVTCGPETAAVNIVEWAAASGRVDVYVMPFWASTIAGSLAGIDRYVYYDISSGDVFSIFWDHSERKWVAEAGGQSVSSAAQRFPADSRHRLTVTWVDAGKLSLTVNGETTVQSAGNCAMHAGGGSLTLGDIDGGGAPLNGYVSDLTLR
jgi:hypothetical protein